jgi:hypothetical protein
MRAHPQKNLVKPHDKGWESGPRRNRTNSYHPLTVSGCKITPARNLSSKKGEACLAVRMGIFQAIGANFEWPEKRRLMLGLFFISFEL